MDLDILIWTGTTFAALIPLVNPLNAVPLFVVMTGELTDGERSRLATRAGLYAGLILLVTAIAGAYILDFFGINLGMLQIAGGLIVGQAAWAMVTGNPQVSTTETSTWEREKRFSLRNVPRIVGEKVPTPELSSLRRRRRRRRPSEPAAGTAGDRSSAPQGSQRIPAGEQPASMGEAAPGQEPESRPTPGQPRDPGPGDALAADGADSATAARPANDIAFSPVAMPLLAGPAAMGVVVGLTSQSTTFSADIGIFLGIAVITAIAILGLRASNAILRTLGASGILALQRIFGFILLSIAVALVANGISALFGIPIYTE